MSVPSSGHQTRPLRALPLHLIKPCQHPRPSAMQDAPDMQCLHLCECAQVLCYVIFQDDCLEMHGRLSPFRCTGLLTVKATTMSRRLATAASERWQPNLVSEMLWKVHNSVMSCVPGPLSGVQCCLSRCCMWTCGAKPSILEPCLSFQK